MTIKGEYTGFQQMKKQLEYEYMTGKEVLRLKVEGKLTEKQIGELLGISGTEVRRILQKGVDMLRSQLEGYINDTNGGR